MEKKQAFTFIEMMVVVVLVGILATIIVPKLYFRKPNIEWPNVLDDFNNLVFYARQEAISAQKNYRLLFKSNKNSPDFIIVQEESVDQEEPTKKIYLQVKSYYFDTKYELDESLKMISFYSGGKEMFEENKDIGYCHILPDGLIQDVMIRLIRKKADRESKVTFKMMPFQGEFVMYEGFLKPEK